jgi:hypothetical protein
MTTAVGMLLKTRTWISGLGPSNTIGLHLTASPHPASTLISFPYFTKVIISLLSNRNVIYYIIIRYMMQVKMTHIRLLVFKNREI